ncbi:MAG: asparagine synthase-related protein [Candidatus Micrarchaeota archaeon]
MARTLNSKLGSLRKKIRSMDSALVALSGGVDSAVLLRICREELGEKAVAVTYLSDDYPSEDLMMAKRIARVVGVKHITVKNDDSCGSQEDECGYGDLKKLARKMRLNAVVNGSHQDDRKEESGHLSAAKRGGAHSPMLECGLSKEEIRALARQFGLPNAKRKSSGKGKSGAKASPSADAINAFLAGLKIKVSAVKVSRNTLELWAEGKELKKLLAASDKIRGKMRALGIKSLVLRIKD